MASRRTEHDDPPHGNGHHPTLPYVQVGAFCRLLGCEKGIAARALQLTILSACRTGEVIFAKWEEFDLDAMVWVIPKERMKAHKEHRVPLARESLTILERMKGLDPVWVFPGAKRGRPMSNMAMANVLERMQRADIAVHGFRSTFRTWAAELTAKSVFESPKAVADFLKLHFAGQPFESFAILYLDARHAMLAFEDVFRGTLAQTSIYPREVLKRALHHDAAAHNHPRGVAEPSPSDELLTSTLKDALKFVDVCVLDHIVVAGAATVSFAERGLL